MYNNKIIKYFILIIYSFFLWLYYKKYISDYKCARTYAKIKITNYKF